MSDRTDTIYRRSATSRARRDAMTKQQLAVVHQAKKYLGWDDAMYRAVLCALGRVESAKDLTPEGFDQVMEYAASCGFKSTWRERTFGHRPGMASPRQIDLIRDLWREWSGGDDEVALNRWLDHFHSCTALRFADQTVAHKAITALKRMVARKKAKTETEPKAG